MTNHAHVLILLSREPSLVLREVALYVGITERFVQDSGHSMAERAVRDGASADAFAQGGGEGGAPGSEAAVPVGALGLVAAYLGGAVDAVMMRLMDLILSIPSLVLAILVVSILGPSLINTIVAVSVVYLPNYVRLVRASALAEFGKDYVIAARVAGVGPIRLMFRTVLPNCLAPLIVQAALGVSNAILEAAALGFLGLQPATGAYVTLARIFTVLYFAFFVLMPFYTRIEKTKPVPTRVTS